MLFPSENLWSSLRSEYKQTCWWHVNIHIIHVMAITWSSNLTTKGNDSVSTNVTISSVLNSPSKFTLPSSKDLNSTILSSVVSSPSATSLLVTIPKLRLSWVSAAVRYAFALSDSASSKNPTTATSLFALNSFTASTDSRVTAAGPVRFLSQLTISVAVRPPV